MEKIPTHEIELELSFIESYKLRSTLCRGPQFREFKPSLKPSSPHHHLELFSREDVSSRRPLRIYSWKLKHFLKFELRDHDEKRMQPHIMCGVGDVAKYVLLSGDPKRVEKIASLFDEARKVAEYRGYVTYSGKVDRTGLIIAWRNRNAPPGPSNISLIVTHKYLILKTFIPAVSAAAG